MYINTELMWRTLTDALLPVRVPDLVEVARLHVPCAVRYRTSGYNRKLVDEVGIAGVVAHSGPHDVREGAAHGLVCAGDRLHLFSHSCNRPNKLLYNLLSYMYICMYMTTKSKVSGFVHVPLGCVPFIQTGNKVPQCSCGGQEVGIMLPVY